MAYATARQIALSEIPVIDVAALRAGDPGATAAIGAAMRAASTEVGFFYISGHGVPEAAIAAARDAARRFFEQPEEAKARVAVNARHRGFIGIGGAKMYSNARIDLKESFVWGLELPEDDPEVAAGNPLLGPNQWPAQPAEMQAALYGYYLEILACGRDLLRAFALALDLPEMFFVERYRRPLARGSVVYYPPQPAEMGSDQFGVAPHTDYGGLTFVWQDDSGGLQVKGREGQWLTAHPIEGTLVINIGDLMARWSNNLFRSTPHRVINASGGVRQSMAVFFDPDYDTVIDPRDIFGPETKTTYQPVTCGDYIRGRFDAAFKYRAAQG